MIAEWEPNVMKMKTKEMKILCFVCVRVFLFHTSHLGLCTMVELYLILLCKPHIYHKYTKTDTLNCICGAFFIGKILLYIFLEEEEKKNERWNNLSFARSQTQNRRRAHYWVRQCVWSIAPKWVCVCARSRTSARDTFDFTSICIAFFSDSLASHTWIEHTNFFEFFFSFFFYFWTILYASLYHTNTYVNE